MKPIVHIGFDLDQTLYPKSPEIDQAIQAYIHQKIAERKQCSVEEGKKLFLTHYPQFSGRKTLLKLGFEDAAEIIQEALERADITSFLVPDPQVSSLLIDLAIKYGPLALITGSSEEITSKKLERLSLDPSLFSTVITGEISKSDGTAFRRWMQAHPDSPSSSFLYIGDRASTDAEVPLSLDMQAILVNVKQQDPFLDCPQLSTVLELRRMLLE